jgi:hypothetical protein
MISPIRKPLLALGACLLGATIVLGTAAPVWSQNQPAADRPNPVAPRRFTFGVNFPGGSVKDFVASLRKASGDVPVNVVVSGDTEGLVLPEIVFEQVTVANAVESLQYLNLPNHVIQISSLDESLPDGVLVISAYRRPAANPTGAAAPAQDVSSDQQVSIFSLAELVQTDADDDSATADVSTLLAAVDAALDMADAKGAEIKFHPDSSLLIVRGTGRQIGLVKQLLDAVYGDILRRRDEMRTLKSDLRDAKTDAQRAEIGLKSAVTELDMARAELDQLQGLHQAGAAGDGDLRKADLNVKQLTGQVQIAELELDQRQARVKDISDRIQELTARQAAPGSSDAIKAEISRLERRIGELKARLEEITHDANAPR